MVAMEPIASFIDSGAFGPSSKAGGGGDKSLACSQIKNMVVCSY